MQKEENLRYFKNPGRCNNYSLCSKGFLTVKGVYICIYVVNLVPWSNVK